MRAVRADDGQPHGQRGAGRSTTRPGSPRSSPGRPSRPAVGGGWWSTAGRPGRCRCAGWRVGAGATAVPVSPASAPTYRVDLPQAGRDRPGAARRHLRRRVRPAQLVDVCAPSPPADVAPPSRPTRARAGHDGLRAVHHPCRDTGRRPGAVVVGGGTVGVGAELEVALLDDGDTGGVQTAARRHQPGGRTCDHPVHRAERSRRQQLAVGHSSDDEGGSERGCGRQLGQRRHPLGGAGGRRGSGRPSRSAARSAAASACSRASTCAGARCQVDHRRRAARR